MAEVADAAGVGVDTVDAGQARFTRPEGDQRPSGPLPPVLAARLAGSSAEIDGNGDAVTQRDDGAANTRTQSGA